MSPFNGNIFSTVIDVMLSCGSFLLFTAFVASQPVSKINNPKVTKPTIIIDRRSVFALYVLSNAFMQAKRERRETNQKKMEKKIMNKNKQDT